MSASWQVTRGSSMRKHNNKRIPPNNRPQHPHRTPPMSKRHKDTLWSPSCHWWRHFSTRPPLLCGSVACLPWRKKTKQKKKNTVFLVLMQASASRTWATHLNYVIIAQWSFKCMDGIRMWIHEYISMQRIGKCLPWFVYQFVGDWRTIACGN